MEGLKFRGSGLDPGFRGVGVEGLGVQASGIEGSQNKGAKGFMWGYGRGV